MHKMIDYPEDHFFRQFRKEKENTCNLIPALNVADFFD